MRLEFEARHPDPSICSLIRQAYEAKMADMDPKRVARECAHAPETPLGDPLTGYLAPYDPYVLLDRGVRRQFDRRRCL